MTSEIPDDTRRVPGGLPIEEDEIPLDEYWIDDKNPGTVYFKNTPGGGGIKFGSHSARKRYVEQIKQEESGNT